MKGLIAGLLLLTAPATTFAQPPDPMDSIILESKTVAPGLSGNPAFTMKVYITNRDTIAILTLALQVSTITGGTYAQLDSTGSRGDPDGWAFEDCVTFLKNTLNANPAEDFSQYDGTSPDRFLVAATFSPTGSNPMRQTEPPNQIRSAIWEIKFMSTSSSLGEVQIDTATLYSWTHFYCIRNIPDGSFEAPVNFVKSIITLQPLKGDMNLDSKLRPADVVLLLNCVFLGTPPPVGLGYCDLNCDGQATVVDVGLLLNAVFREEEFPC